MKRLLILCGGKSAEHEISLKTTRNILKALDRTQFTPIVVGVSHSGTWYYLEDEKELEKVEKIEDTYPLDFIASLVKFPAYACLTTQQGITIPIDVALSSMHGPNGEDGTIQGLFELSHLPYIGAGVLTCAVAMDKDIFKQLLRFHQIPTTDSLTLKRHDPLPTYASLTQTLGSDFFFVKPACMGSSVGITKVKEASQLVPAIEEAFEYSRKVIIEKGVKCREIECAILGNAQPKASILGEICPTHEFYTYEAKYIDPNGAALIIPAELSPDTVENIQQIALQTFKVTDCKGLARIDFFLSDKGDVYVNELNTFPGFTDISMYPKLWQESGISYAELISQLIHLAYEEFEFRKELKVDY